MPCPFCGSRATLSPDDPDERSLTFRIICTGCRASTPHPFAFAAPEDAVAAWNWRVDLSPAASAAQSASREKARRLTKAWRARSQRILLNRPGQKPVTISELIRPAQKAAPKSPQRKPRK